MSEQERTKVRVRQFMNILEQLPRLCSPTICGTLSQPTTRAERANRGSDMFEWSLEQKAILSPANITTNDEANEEWQNNVAELNRTWRQKESDNFFSQRTIAPSPMITPSARRLGRPMVDFDLMYDEDEEDEEEEEEEETDKDNDDNDSQQQQAQDLSTFDSPIFDGADQTQDSDGNTKQLVDCYFEGFDESLDQTMDD